MKPHTQENLMRRYLLGDLPDAEAASMEEEVFTNDEKFERMWEVENTLVDGYVRGRLSSEERKGFELHYLASPVHRQRVAFARNLIEKTDISRAAVIEPKMSLWARLLAMRGPSPAVWRLAATAAVLLAVVSLWLFVDRARLRDELAQLKAESQQQQQSQQSLSDQIAVERSESEKLKGEIERLRAEREAGAKKSSRPVETSPSSIISFVLSPMLIRSGGDLQTLDIPPAIHAVRLQMKAEPSDTRSFQVSLRTVEGRRVWKQQNIKPHSDDTARVIITIQIPAAKLAMGDYILTLSATSRTGETEEANRYFFRVIRQ